MQSLILTLGHNSSAIYVEDGVILAGYETERFTLHKSDSTYPRQPIEELNKRFNIGKDVKIFIGHWFLDGELPEKSNKYLDYEHLKELFPDSTIESLSKEFTHHDSHLLSAQVFAGYFAPGYFAIVADGFGTMGECLSVYKVVPGRGHKLMRRVFGFENSLGMLYQYATAYMGMKQHNHEYKILAYEVGVDPQMYSEIVEYAKKASIVRFKRMMGDKLSPSTDPAISLNALPEIQMQISEELDMFCEEFDVDKLDETEFRTCVSLYVQTVVEQVIRSVVGFYQMDNVLLSGGLFYNVKLNNLISKWIPGKTCVMPLAGDQGAGLGVYQHHVGDLLWPGHLCLGPRDLDFISDVPGIVTYDTFEEAFDDICDTISNVGFVNLVRGSMEFGPRALCNTSTLALPRKEICEVINVMNDRTSEMPMAPVCTPEKAKDLFKHLDSVHKSLDYMIITRDYQDHVTFQEYDGIMHHYPRLGVSTGRPQIVDKSVDPDLYSLVATFGGVLINTSFNYHGVPIVFDKASIEYTHTQQHKNSPLIGIKTIVIRN